jgi:DNA-binding NarL/FixJ family response regulator
MGKEEQRVDGNYGVRSVEVTHVSTGAIVSEMQKIILGDPQAIFRAGMAKVLAVEEDIRIVAQCPDLEHLNHAMRTLSASVILVAANLRPDFAAVLESARKMKARMIVIAENSDSADEYTSLGAHGVVYRNINGPALVECLRRVLKGETWVQTTAASLENALDDMVGQRVRDRLTPKELKIVALIVQGCKNKEIAMRLGTTEQVIKNYLRSIYDKTGVSDRLELALFTIHHRTLAEAATKAVDAMQMLQGV